MKLITKENEATEFAKHMYQVGSSSFLHPHRLCGGLPL